MKELYKSKYYGDLSFFIQHGWTEEEINEYFPYLENAPDEDLLILHTLVDGHMFNPGEAVDQEMAIHLLVNPHDTPKTLLISAIKRLQVSNSIRSDLRGAIITMDDIDLLITDEAAVLIEKQYDMILLRRLVDRKDLLFPLVEVKKAIKEGIIDWTCQIN